jgi:hypothetical protein
LGTLSTRDLSQIPSKYKHIIDIKGDNMIDFNFSINECKDIKNVKDEYKLGPLSLYSFALLICHLIEISKALIPNFLDLTLSSLCFIYMESFVSELLTYLSVFGDIFEKTRQAVANYISELYQSPTKGTVHFQLFLVHCFLPFFLPSFLSLTDSISHSLSPSIFLHSFLFDLFQFFAMK